MTTATMQAEGSYENVSSEGQRLLQCASARVLVSGVQSPIPSMYDMQGHENGGMVTPQKMTVREIFVTML